MRPMAAGVPTLIGVSERLATQRLERLEQDIADVDRALATLEELHAETKGRGGAEAAERIELQVGRDLQFVRINGTVVGALAGVVIYSVGQLLG